MRSKKLRKNKRTVHVWEVDFPKTFVELFSLDIPHNARIELSEAPGVVFTASWEELEVNDEED